MSDVACSQKFGLVYREMKQVLFAIILTKSILLVMLCSDNVPQRCTGNLW